MTTATAEFVQDVPGEALDVLASQTRGEVDVQIRTARAYPRSIKTFMHTALEMATLDEDTAASCFYAIPRDGKTVEGPSARLAEICASAWGHMRSQARIVNEDDRFITARGESWDTQTNVAVGFEVRRRITGRNGKKYSDDMIMVTGNAASSIALRNAIFKVVPSSFWRPIYLKCREVAVGKAETLVAKRAKMLAYFQKMGVVQTRVFDLLGVQGEVDITLDHMATLHGLATAIKDGDTSIDEAFPVGIDPPRRTTAEAPAAPDGAERPNPGPSPQATTPTPSAAVASPAAQTTPTPAPAPPEPPAELPKGADRLVQAKRQELAGGRVWWWARTERGRIIHTFDADLGAQLLQAQAARALVGIRAEAADGDQRERLIGLVVLPS